jgi:hypothetical protein
MAKPELPALRQSRPSSKERRLSDRHRLWQFDMECELQQVTVDSEGAMKNTQNVDRHEFLIT